MHRSLALIVCCWMCAGCHRASVKDDEAGRSRSQANASLNDLKRSVASFSMPRVSNRFGMTFCLVSVDQHRIDTAISEHEVELPQQSFYLQQTELTEEQFSAYRDMAIQRTGKDPAVRSEIIFPTEWRDVYNLSFELSIDDPDYDYRLPTREEWAFACMNGYDQDCPGVGQAAHEPIPANQPNKYDIQGLLNYDAECGDVPGLLLGIQYPLPSESNDVLPCRCLQFMVGNPDADDGMNELITARFVLVPQSAPTNP